MSQTAAGARSARSPAATFIFVTMLLDWLVVGIMSPVLPKLIVEFRAGRRRSAETG